MKFRTKVAVCIIILCITIYITTVILSIKRSEYYSRKNNTLWRLTGSIIIPNGGIHRKVNVPLTPLTAPLQKATLPNGVKIPSFLIYRTEYLSNTGDQGDICGSCWAFSICNMISDRIAINTLGKFRENISVQHLLQCFEPEEACNGNSPETALEFLEKRKIPIPLERDEPYKQLESEIVSGGCSTSLSKSATIRNVRSITKFIKETGYSEDILKDNILNMKKELLTHGPFFAAMSVYSDFFEYDGLRVYSHSKDSTLVGGHAIEVIGWCDPGIDPRSKILNDVDKGYWICRNSWSSSWPSRSNNKGYFLIRMGINESGIESRCGSADPDMIMRGFEEERFMMWLDIDKFLRADPRRMKGMYI